jgi:two-component system, LytTR family, sensor kinase
MVPGGDVTVAEAQPPQVSDLWPRLLLSPIIGAVLPNLAGLIDNSRHSAAGLAASYLYFTCVALVIWEGNRRIYFRLQRREEWLQRPRHRIALLLSAITIYTVPVAALLLWIWQAVTDDPGTRGFAIPTALLATVTCVVVITHAYETVFLLRDWESDRLRRARTEQARLEAELQALGRAVDPHFLFNNLNTLVHLVESRNDAAVPFVTALAATYRYVLESRNSRLVSLASELDALGRHATLSRIRFGDRILMRIEVDPVAARRLLLPPVTLPELFQNAVKHNDVSGLPFSITVKLDGEELIFVNDRRPGTAPGPPSTGVGLQNLSQRFRLAVGREIAWSANDTQFEVRVPLKAG